MNRLEVRRIAVDGRLGPGVYAKDVILRPVRFWLPAPCCVVAAWDKLG
jgi:hypothetical protein